MNIWEKLEFKSYLLVDPSILLRWNDRLEYVLGAGTIERILCKFNHFDRDNQIYLIGVYLQFFFFTPFLYYITCSWCQIFCSRTTEFLFLRCILKTIYHTGEECSKIKRYSKSGILELQYFFMQIIPIFQCGYVNFAFYMHRPTPILFPQR